MAFKALAVGTIHLGLQFLLTFYGLIFMGMPEPVPGSLRAISLSAAGRATEVLTFPKVQIVYPFHPLDPAYKIFLVFLGNSVLWAGCFYLLLRMVTRLRKGGAKVG